LPHVVFIEQRETDMTALELLAEATEEDRREGSRFDAWGFAAFFPEEDPETVREAWVLYCDTIP
jgi:hypothetical protein